MKKTKGKEKVGEKGKRGKRKKKEKERKRKKTFCVDCNELK